MKSFYRIRYLFARTGFYILSIGGLLILFAAILWYVWNRYCVCYLQYSQLSFLEAIGLVSIAYLVFSSVQFAISGTDHVSDDSQCSARSSTNELSAEDKEQIKNEISKYCRDRGSE